MHQRRVIALQALFPLRGHRTVANDRGWCRGLRGRAARLSHLLLLEEEPKVRGTGGANLLDLTQKSKHQISSQKYIFSSLSSRFVFKAGV